MGYYLYDANGYVGDVASGGGLADLRNHVAGRKDAVGQFFSEGHADPKKLLAGLEAVEKPEDHGVAKTLKNLIRLVKKCDEIAILTDGVFSAGDTKKTPKRSAGRTKHFTFGDRLTD